MANRYWDEDGFLNAKCEKCENWFKKFGKEPGQFGSRETNLCYDCQQKSDT